jgi:aspartyl-tRNA synthetase
LRGQRMQSNLRLRTKLTRALRQYLDGQDFQDLETPILTRATPEGARDYLVPSRVHPGSFYALPQSPQLFKQMLIMGGMDRYYQIARCFRDEDLRADRQPEFTHNYEVLAKKHGARGLAWMKINTAGQGVAGVQSSIAKFLSDDIINAMQDAAQAQAGDLLFFGAGPEQQVNAFMGAVRLQLGRDLELLESGWKPLWVVDFPMFEYDDESARLYALHHPFTTPSCSLEAMQKAPEQALSRAYDMVLNGSEIGGGSIRIHRPDMQQAVFDLLGIDPAQAQDRFGFLLEALKYGCPPLGGIAFGVDRIAALMAGEASIRDVIAFPKTTTAACPLTQAPSLIDQTQLDELSLRVQIERE